MCHSLFFRKPVSTQTLWAGSVCDHYTDMKSESLDKRKRELNSAFDDMLQAYTSQSVITMIGVYETASASTLFMSLGPQSERPFQTTLRKED